MNNNPLQISEQYLVQQQKQGNTKLCLNFSNKYDNFTQIDKLLQLLEFGNCKKEKEYKGIGGSDDEIDEKEQEEEVLIINESQTGKNIHTLILNAPNQYLIGKNISTLSNFTKFCPNLVSLHINIDQNHLILQQSLLELFKDIATHLDKLRDIKFNMDFTILSSQIELGIIKHVSSILTLQSLSLNMDFSHLSIKEWKLVYSQFTKLKKLNTLILKTQYSYQQILPDKKQIAHTYHKKLPKLVTKNISIIAKEYWENVDYEEDQTMVTFFD